MIKRSFRRVKFCGLHKLLFKAELAISTLSPGWNPAAGSGRLLARAAADSPHKAVPRSARAATAAAPSLLSPGGGLFYM